MPLSAARARSLERLVLEVTAFALVASALVTPALSSDGGHGNRPPAPTHLAVAQATQTTISWSWEAEPTLAYRLFKDDRFVEPSSATTSTFDALECGHSYVLGVEAVDDNGRRSDRASVTAASAPCAVPAPVPPPIPEPTPQPTPEPPQDAPPDLPTGPAPDTSPPDPALVEPAPSEQKPSLWQTAGAFVWHENAVDPEQLGRELRDNGFGWVAVELNDGTRVDPVEDDWLRRFREASGGLPVGGWGVLRTDPVAEAQLASSLLDRYSLGFYIADAESEYKYSGDDGPSAARYGRSRQFVDTFRALRSDLPAAVSSYCRADRENIDWGAWASAGFEFMPQAYVNDFGDYVTPAACAEGAAAYFPADAVHPTIGMYAGQQDVTTPETYANLLQAAHTVGFSVYLAETHMESNAWSVLGNAISDLGIAATFDSGLPDQPSTDQP
jgi:hypothetical protein